ncbi:hypothetical protein PFISCL1PPCAC_8166, partial [Pristionchus fissidentatus]
ISDRWVVTSYAALKVLNNKDTTYRVQAGMLDHTNVTDSTEQFLSVQDIQFVNGFESDTHFNDIALLQLSKPLHFNQYVQPICLPDSDENAMKPGHNAWFTSWGSSTKRDMVSDDLRQAELFINDYEVCDNAVQWYNQNQHLCVGGVNGKSTCFNDMGGPLMRQNADGAWYLYGFSVSDKYTGTNCAHATVFTRATEFCWFYEEVAK